MRPEECPVRPALNAIGGYPILAAKPVILLRARAASPRHDRCQPLEPVSQKFTTPLAKIADPIYAPPKREDIVKNLLAAVGDVWPAGKRSLSGSKAMSRSRSSKNRSRQNQKIFWN